MKVLVQSDRHRALVTAITFNILSKAELDGMELPYVIFQDLDFGNPIPYDENKFDIIFSQNTVKHFKYKFELFNEILRVLKPGGISLHTDIPAINIYNNGLVLSTQELIVEFRKRGLEFFVLENRQTFMFRKREEKQTFPLSPHQAIPETPENLPKELGRPDMGYNLL